MRVCMRVNRTLELQSNIQPSEIKKQIFTAQFSRISKIILQIPLKSLQNMV